MTVRLTSDRAALVDTRLKYIPIDPQNPPQGKVLLINRHRRQPVTGEYSARFDWTHYHPLPTFDDAEDQGAS